MVIELFLGFIFYNYYKIEEEHLSEQLFLEMKNYSFSFEGERFEMDIVPKDNSSKLYELYFDEKNLYILTPFLEENSSLAILYPIESYHQELTTIQQRLLLQFLLLSFISGVLSLLFSLYALSPLKESMRLLEEFIKDIIHDLNTPITSILINLKMMERNEETLSIEQSAKTISMLHKNLDVYLRNKQLALEEVALNESIMEQVDFFKPLYNHLEWRIKLEACIISSNRPALNRILYNLLSNACKYNTSNGFIEILATKESLTISNSSHGVQHPKRVFHRFYKESERGLGIGLHIVEKLCHELKITKEFTVKEKIVSVTLTF